MTSLKKTSRPAIVWKNSSCGLMPVKNRWSTNPPARGEVSKERKEGSVRPAIVIGGRCPSSSIWPNSQLIY